MEKTVAPGGVGAIDAELRALLTGDSLRAAPALAAFGQPALERLLDLIAGRVTLPQEGGQRQTQDGLSDAIVAFAKRDLDAVLAGVEARGVQEAVSVVWALGCISDPRVVPILLRSAASTAPLARTLAVSGLARQRDDRATDALISALKDRVSDVRERAAEALGDLGDPRAIKPLEAAHSSGYAAREPYFADVTKSALEKIRAAAPASGAPATATKKSATKKSATKKRATKK